MVKLSESPDVRRRIKAVALRIRLGDVAALSIALRFPPVSGIERVDWADVWLAVQMVNDTRAIPALGALLKSEDVSLRQSAALALRQIEDDRVVPVLAGALSDTDQDVVCHAMYGLAARTNRNGPEWLPPFYCNNDVLEDYAYRWRSWWLTQRQNAASDARN